MTQPYSQLLNEIGALLDLTETQYKEIEDRYNAVAKHLSKDISLLRVYQPDIIPQGSFLLGTMVKPIMDDDEIDVDLVCRLRHKHDSWAQHHLKEEVGDQIKSDETYKKMLKPFEGRRRCWRLDYAEDTKFHMDILPAIINREHFALLEKQFKQLTSSELESLSIRITDWNLANYRTEVNAINWLKSNPFGYNGWFRDRMTPSNQRMLLAESVKPLPKYVKNKTPLQRSIQILKRHRDIMFGNDEHKPISIIITTLAAWAYNGEQDLVEALQSILQGMRNHIKYVFSSVHNKNIAEIANPVNSQENFADKWPEHPQKEENFHAWLDKAQVDFAVLRGQDATTVYRTLKSILGTRAVNEAFRNTGLQSVINENYLPALFNSASLSVQHRERPRWPLNLTSRVEISGHYKQGKKRISIYPNTRVPKGCDIFFTASSNVKRPFDVYWQVVNTGEDAMRANGLRGEIFQSKTLGVGGLTQKEYSSYSGTHWVQCFIVKNNYCVAKSYEFFVTTE